MRLQAYPLHANTSSCTPLNVNGAYFSTNARYEFHINRVTDKDVMAIGKKDLSLRFEFGKHSSPSP
jgi:hypothetical protein